MRSSLEVSPKTLVSSWLTSSRNSKGTFGSGGTEWERGSKNRQFLANKPPHLRNGAKYDHSHNDGLIGSRIALSIGTKIIDLGWLWTADMHSVAEKMRLLEHQMTVGLSTTAIFGDLSGYLFGSFRDKASENKVRFVRAEQVWFSCCWYCCRRWCHWRGWEVWRWLQVQGEATTKSNDVQQSAVVSVRTSVRENSLPGRFCARRALSTCPAHWSTCTGQLQYITRL